MRRCSDGSHRTIVPLTCTSTKGWSQNTSPTSIWRLMGWTKTSNTSLVVFSTIAMLLLTCVIASNVNLLQQHCIHEQHPWSHRFNTSSGCSGRLASINNTHRVVSPHTRSDSKRHRWYGFRPWFAIAGRRSVYLCRVALTSAGAFDTTEQNSLK